MRRKRRKRDINDDYYKENSPIARVEASCFRVVFALLNFFMIRNMKRKRKVRDSRE
jgi:hypothetical protein